MLAGVMSIRTRRREQSVQDDQPVIFISGYGRDETIASALDAGADDYIVKPFSPTELVARIRAALRRRADPVPMVLGDLAIDYDRRRVTVAGRAVELTATEYELLRVLSQGAGRVLTHNTLLRRVWNGADRRPEDRARLREAAAQQARRRCAAASLHSDRAPGGLPACPGPATHSRLKCFQGGYHRLSLYGTSPAGGRSVGCWPGAH